MSYAHESIIGVYELSARIARCSIPYRARAEFLAPLSCAHAGTLPLPHSRKAK